MSEDWCADAPRRASYNVEIEEITMAIPNTAKRKIPPTHPGKMLKEDFMPDFNLSVTTLAKALGVACQTVNELLRERHAVSTLMALRLSRLLGNSPEFWLSAQQARDLWESEHEYREELCKIKSLRVA